MLRLLCLTQHPLSPAAPRGPPPAPAQPCRDSLDARCRRSPR